MVMKILAVDDNYDIVKMLRMTVESMGHMFYAEYAGRKGLQRIRNELFDLVFLDLSMPGYTGLDVIDALTRDNLLRRQPVVLFTASHMDVNTLEKSMAGKGLYAVLPKPADIDQIMNIIQSVESSSN